MRRTLVRLVPFIACLGLVAVACSQRTTIGEISSDRASLSEAESTSRGGDGTDIDGEVTDEADDAGNRDQAAEEREVDGAEADGDTDDGTDDGAPVDTEDELSDAVASLVADCTDGSDMACDILFQVSDLRSPEEDLALTCGNRRPDVLGFCTEAILTDGTNVFFDESSPGLPAVVGACEVGDMTACDFLYFRSPLGSTYEELGNTCAGRIEIAIPDCRTIFADQ